MIYGYARVSTKGQAKDGNSLEAQEKALREAGATEIYREAFTGTKTDRPEFTKLIDELQEGDTLVVTKLDRIARTAAKGIELVDGLLNRGIKIHILNMGLLDNSTTGKLIRKGQILRSTSNTAPLTCGACNTQPEGLLTMA